MITGRVAMEINKSNEIINGLLHQKNEISKAISEIKARMKNTPEGILRIAKKGGKYQYYQRKTQDDFKGTFIRRKDDSLAAALAQKDYDAKLLKALTEQQSAIDNFLKNYDPDAVVQVFENLSEARKQLVTPAFLTDEKFVKQWQNEPYDRLGFGKEEPEYYTARGERVRSKSEILIADALYRHKIPYRYEFPVYNKGVIIAAPDFNCLNVRLRKEYFWEHLGMMGEEKYADRNVKKLEKYTFAEDFDETNLIITMETDNKPLDTRVIDEKIRRFLL